jgi:hypothetical protein
MNNITLIISSFAGMLAVAGIVTLYWNMRILKSQVEELKSERNQIRNNYDQLRKEKIESDEKLTQIQSQERTYKVAYEDWKSKYESLEIRYQALKRDLDSKSTQAVHLNTEVVADKKPQSNNLGKEQPLHSESQILSELKLILDQHLELLKNFMNEGSAASGVSKAEHSDPLHWIMGIDEDTSVVLKNLGIRTFRQLAELPKKEIRKMMLQFEDIEDKVIESWPLQANAILNTQAATAG